MRIINEHPCDLSQPYDQVEEEITWIKKDSRVHIFKHNLTPHSIYIWYVYAGKGIYMDEVYWNTLRDLIQ